MNHKCYKRLQQNLFISKMEQHDQHNMIPIEIPKCIGGKNVGYVCVNTYNCANFQRNMCSQKQCECQIQHAYCSRTPVFRIFDQMKQRKKECIESSVQQVNTIQETMKHTTNQLQKFMVNLGLTASEVKFINLLKSQKYGNIHQDIHKIMKPQMVYQIRKQQQIRVFCNKFKESFDKLFKQFEDNIKIIFLQDSKIIENKNDKLWIESRLKQNIQFEFTSFLLYRASENNFEAEKFHQLCDANKDEIKNTLIIVKRDTQKSKIIGGYSTNTWNEMQYQVSKKDEQMKSFLFSLDLKEKYSLIDSQKQSITCRKRCGPIFGGELPDLCIQDKANTTEQSLSLFPNSYNLKQGSGFKYSREAPSNYIDVTGSQDGNFKVIQYEVYQIVKK